MVLLAVLTVGLPAAPGWAAPPVPTPTPEPPLPGQGPGGTVVGGERLARDGLVLPAGARPLPTDISARAWLVADLDTGQVLAARDAHGRFPPASTQKWLTALTLLPRFTNKKRVVRATEADTNVDGTRVGLVPGGKYTVDLLFQSMLMASGNDAANALARVAGGVPGTLAWMNAEAKRLQAYDTHAATPSGLDGPGQLTSPYDLALIGRAALARADFRRYTAQRRGRVPAVSARYGAFEFANGNKLLYNYPGAIGGKNGFTDAARHTFIGVAQRGKRRLIVTMMRGEHRPTQLSEQAGRLLDWGFAARGSVGELVGPATGPAPTTAAPAPSSTARPAASAAPAAAPEPGDGPPMPLIATGLGAVVLAGWGAAALARRRR
jgi:serine-type D-Ala-D-Ala carboxypeptidase (penicillin-binding protein 5/6)